MGRLRGSRGCPWDREQSHQSLRPYVIEEAYEVLEAIDSGSSEQLRDELGDLLLQVVFHAQIASEEGRFDASSVCDTIADKLERRHPHVFGTLEVKDSHEVAQNWATIKAAERAARGEPASALAGVPQSLPALLGAERLGEKAGRVGFDWPSVAAVLQKVREELGELEEAIQAGSEDAVVSELGDVLMSLASVGRHLDVSAELALRTANLRFTRRFQKMERRAAEEGVPLGELGLDQLERLWELAKKD